jgi:hypothetical protein
MHAVTLPESKTLPGLELYSLRAHHWEFEL